MSDRLRITGMVTGLDTDEMVKKLINVEQVKVDKVKQEKQYTIWKQDAYREISNLARGFKDEYFNYLKPESNMRSSNLLNNYKVTYNGENVSNYLNITATNESTLENTAITQITTAKRAETVGSSLTDGVVGTTISNLDINTANDNHKITVIFNGIRKEIVIDNGVNDMDSLVNDLQEKLDTSFGSGKINVGTLGISGEAAKQLKFETDKTNIFSLGYAYNNGYKDLFGQDLNQDLTLTAENNKFKLTLNDTVNNTHSTEVIELTTGNNLSIDELISDMQSKIDTAFGDGSLESSEVKVVKKDNRIVLASTSEDIKIFKTSQENKGLKAIGFIDANKSNKIDLSAKLAMLAEHFSTKLTTGDTDGDGYDLEFSINEEKFSFKSTETSLNEIISAVNSRADANAIMRYDQLNDQLVVESRDTGITSKLEINDLAGEGNLMSVLGLNGVAEKGSDAQVKFADGTTIVRSINAFTMDGLNFDLKNDFSGSMDIAINTNSTKSFELIKGFVEKYNELITKVNDKLSEEKDWDYRPLTAEEKKDMSEKDIELWEEKAKSGILRSDHIIYKMVSKMRMAIYKEVDGVGISLFDLGIDTSKNYKDGGKLVLNEEKLKAVLKDNPQDVVDLFTKVSDSDEDKGISHRLFDIIEENIRTTRDSNGRKGILLEKAGIEGDLSEFKNILSQRVNKYDDTIDDLLDDLVRKEEHYYQMFARMESAISRMNTQSSWLMSQFGGGTQ